MVFRYRVLNNLPTPSVSFSSKSSRAQATKQSHATKPQSHATKPRHMPTRALLRTQSSDPIASENPLPLSRRRKKRPISCTAELANPHTFRQPSRACHSSCRWNKKETSPRYLTTTMDGMPASLEEWRNRLFHVTEVMTLTEEE